MFEEFRERSRKFRQQMPVAEKYAYFDHAAVAPLPAPTRDAIQAWAQEAAAEGDVVWPHWQRRVERLRETAATMIGATAEEIAIVPNTTAGIGIVAEGFPWQDGDNIVTFANEFPSNLYPWMNLASRGVETRLVPVEGIAADLQRLADACDARTRIISASWVGFATGWRIDVDALVDLAHRRGILVFLDAIQGMGVFPLDVDKTKVDFLAADGHKWMMGPEGAGIFYSRREHLDLLRPVGVGWNSVVNRFDYGKCELELRPEAARYEGGSQNMVGVAGLDASLNLLTELGVTKESSRVADYVVELNRHAAQRLESIGANIVSDLSPAHASGILAFDLPDRDLSEQRRRCLKEGVILSLRGGNLRIAPHAYSNQTDIERLADVLSRGK